MAKAEKKAAPKKAAKKPAAKAAAKKPSQKEQVLKYLASHKGGITKAIALEKLGVKTLSKVVSDLKKAGNDVVCEKVTPKKGEPYFVYKLGK